MGKDWNAELEKVNADMAKLTAELEAHGSAQTTSQTCKECVDNPRGSGLDSARVHSRPARALLSLPCAGRSTTAAGTLGIARRGPVAPHAAQLIFVCRARPAALALLARARAPAGCRGTSRPKWRTTCSSTRARIIRTSSRRRGAVSVPRDKQRALPTRARRALTSRPRALSQAAALCAEVPVAIPVGQPAAVGDR